MTESAPGVETWKAHTTAFDRVRSVAVSASGPRTAAEIAADAAVAENTARDHLERLVEMNVVLRGERGGTTTYAPDPLHARAGSIRELLDTHDHDGLIELKAELQERTAEWAAEYEVDSPRELRERAADAEDAATTRRMRADANDWELVAHRLGLVEEAIRNYTTYSRSGRASA
jgi:predicted ArsR family transcriptional regulator